MNFAVKDRFGVDPRTIRDDTGKNPHLGKISETLGDLWNEKGIDRKVRIDGTGKINENRIVVVEEEIKDRVIWMWRDISNI